MILLFFVGIRKEVSYKLSECEDFIWEVNKLFFLKQNCVKSFLREGW